MAAVLATALFSLPAAAGPALLFDPSSSTVLYAEDVDQVWHPASLTKLMTAYVAFKALQEGKLKLDQELTVSESAFKTPPSKLGLKIGEKISVIPHSFLAVSVSAWPLRGLWRLSPR